MPIHIRLSAEAKMPGYYDCLAYVNRPNVPRRGPDVIVSADRLTAPKIEESLMGDQILVTHLKVVIEHTYGVNAATHSLRAISYVIPD